MDLDYLSSRMEEERDCAARAESEQARAAHQALADQYAAEIARLNAAAVVGSSGSAGLAAA